MSRLDTDGGVAEALPRKEDEPKATDPPTEANPVDGREFGKYRLTRRLARGGMGEVYVARLVGELGFEKTLVIKTILPELAEKPRFIEMFAAEAKTAVALSHGNIVPTYELGRAADTFYIAMGYVDGPSVAQLLEAAEAKGHEPDIPAALHVLRGVLAGLSYAHREEPGRPAVVHRDITPRNILIDRSGQVRIVDFGIAAPARRQVGVRAGSAGYMSPEQARGDAADPRADVFSVGCMLYELCTHKRAFPKEGIWVAPDVSALPDELRGPLERALQSDPDARFKDATEMNAALRLAFTTHAGTYDDAALGRKIATLFPRGWGRGEDRVPGDSGSRPMLSAPSETYATVLTAITGIDPNVLAPSAEDGVPTDAVAETPDSTGPEGAAESTAAAVSLHHVPAQRESGFRVSTLAMVLGALGIGIAAFAVGRTESRSDGPEITQGAVEEPVGRSSAGQSVSAAVDDPPTPTARATAASEPPDTAAERPPAQLLQQLSLVPKDAAVEVDGERLPGDGPHRVTLPQEGTVKVRVYAKGYRAQTLELSADDLSADEPLKVELEPQPTKPREPGGLRVLAPTVAWAEVRVDGKKVGNTPTRRISVPSGRHKVEVRCVPDVCSPARTLYKQSVTVEPGKTTRIDAQ